MIVDTQPTILSLELFGRQERFGYFPESIGHQRFSQAFMAADQQRLAIGIDGHRA